MTKARKVIVAGGRDFDDKRRLFYEIYNLMGEELFELVSGTCKGADVLGEEYAEARGLKVTKFPPEWHKYGRAAGPRRNMQMAEYGDVLIAFWDGLSKGTNHMINTAHRLGLEVHVFMY